MNATIPASGTSWSACESVGRLGVIEEAAGALEHQHERETRRSSGAGGLARSRATRTRPITA